MTVKAVLFDLENTLVYQNPYENFQKMLRINGKLDQLNRFRESEAIFVGNRIEPDHVGAKNARMATILIRRNATSKKSLAFDVLQVLRKFQVPEEMEGKALALNWFSQIFKVYFETKIVMKQFGQLLNFGSHLFP